MKILIISDCMLIPKYVHMHAVCKSYVNRNKNTKGCKIFVNQDLHISISAFGFVLHYVMTSHDFTSLFLPAKNGASKYQK